MATGAVTISGGGLGAGSFHRSLLRAATREKAFVVLWDGANRQGRRVGAGTYIAVLRWKCGGHSGVVTSAVGVKEMK